LLDKVVKLLPEEAINEETDELPKFAIIGRPNVGKSSLINALIGEDRNIVTDIAGTTRDSINTRYNKYGHDFVLIDTAGLRKKGKVHENLEFYSVMRSIRSIEDSDVCIILVDATRGVEAQDMAIYNLAIKNKKGIVFVVNKWDLVEKETNTMKEFTKVIQNRIAPFNDVPIIFTSALTKQRIHKVLDTAVEVAENKKQKIPTSRLNEFLQEAVAKFPPPSVKDKYIKIKYVTQLPTKNPTFAFFANLPQYVRDPYKRYLENRIREKWNYKGVPITIVMRNK